MLQKALEFLRKHNEITFATTDGTSPKLRIFQIMHQVGTTLYFATSSKKAVWHELQANPNVELLAFADNISVRCSGMVSFDVSDDVKRWIYGFNDVYGQSLSFVLERAIFCVDNQCPDGQGRISAIVERRGKREDKNLMNYYQQLLDKGTYWVTAERMKNHMNCLDFKWKSEDIAGLQIADLIAYPLTRHVLNPQAVNLAYDVLAPKIFMEDGKLLGLKIYPSQQT